MTAFHLGTCPPPSDAEIRSALLERLRVRHREDASVAFLEELGLCRGKVRVDVAVVNGAIHGYEIKSDRDSLRRLRGQAEVYGKVLDRATLVVGPRHASEAMEDIPNWWEVEIVTTSAAGLSIRQLRRGRKNPNRQARSLVELLWLEDSQAFLASHGHLRGYGRRPRRELWDRICELHAIDEIASAVREQLKARAMRGSVEPRT